MISKECASCTSSLMFHCMLWLYGHECNSYLKTNTKYQKKVRFFLQTFLKSRDIGGKHEQFQHLCSSHAYATCIHKIPCIYSETNCAFCFEIISDTFDMPLFLKVFLFSDEQKKIVN